MDLGLSVLYVSPVSSGSDGTRALRNTLELARLADRLGYERYWLAEHHNLPSVASSAPEIMIGHVAGVTKSIRVGAGGIMLPNHTLLKGGRDLQGPGSPAPGPHRPRHRPRPRNRPRHGHGPASLLGRARRGELPAEFRRTPGVLQRGISGGSSFPVRGRDASRRRAAADLAARLQRLLGEGGRTDGLRLRLRLALQPGGPGPRHARLPRELRAFGVLRAPFGLLARVRTSTRG